MRSLMVAEFHLVFSVNPCTCMDKLPFSIENPIVVHCICHKHLYTVHSQDLRQGIKTRMH